MRKRTLTNYQNLLSFQKQDEHSQQEINQSTESFFSPYQQQNEQWIRQNPEKKLCKKTSTNSNMTSLGLIKSQKIKIHQKFQKIRKLKSKNSHQYHQISTIQSLKKDILAIQNDQIISYRLRSRKNDSQSRKQDQNSNIEESLVLKLKNFKKQLVTDKFRRKIASLNSKKKQFDEIREIIGLNINQQLKMKTTRQRYLSQKNRVSTSITAIKFYRPQTRCNSARSISSFSLSEKQGSVKKLTVKSKTSQQSSRSFGPVFE